MTRNGPAARGSSSQQKKRVLFILSGEYSKINPQKQTALYFTILHCAIRHYQVLSMNSQLPSRSVFGPPFRATIRGPLRESASSQGARWVTVSRTPVVQLDHNSAAQSRSLLDLVHVWSLQTLHNI